MEFSRHFLFPGWASPLAGLPAIAISIGLLGITIMVADANELVTPGGPSCLRPPAHGLATVFLYTAFAITRCSQCQALCPQPSIFMSVGGQFWFSSSLVGSRGW